MACICVATPHKQDIGEIATLRWMHSHGLPVNFTRIHSRCGFEKIQQLPHVFVACMKSNSFVCVVGQKKSAVPTLLCELISSTLCVVDEIYLCGSIPPVSMSA